MKNEILVTSATGFPGRRLVAALEGRGFTVRLYASANGDIANCALPMEGVGHLFHLAGKSYVPASWKDPRGVFHQGSGRSACVAEVAQLVSDAAGIATPVVNADGQPPGEVLDGFTDTSRAASDLGWRPRPSLAEGIAAVAAAERAARG
jgi:nucleoside-diphosphate-sugar epimerase